MSIASATMAGVGVSDLMIVTFSRPLESAEILPLSHPFDGGARTFVGAHGDRMATVPAPDRTTSVQPPSGRPLP